MRPRQVSWEEHCNLTRAEGASLVQAAIERALTYDKCLRLGGQDRLACFLDRATINVGAMFAKQVQGRVSTEVQPLSQMPDLRGCTRAQC